MLCSRGTSSTGILCYILTWPSLQQYVCALQSFVHPALSPSWQGWEVLLFRFHQRATETEMRFRSLHLYWPMFPKQNMTSQFTSLINEWIRVAKISKLVTKREMRGLEDKDRLEQNQCQTYDYSLSQRKLSTGTTVTEDSVRKSNNLQQKKGQFRLNIRMRVRAIKSRWEVELSP